TQFVFFMAGAISYHLFVKIRTWKIMANTSIAVTLCFLISGIFNHYLVPTYLQDPILFLETMLVMPLAFRVSLTSKLDRYLGELSYSIYLSQALIIMVTAPKIFSNFFGRSITSILLCIVFAVIAHEIVTKPI